MKQCTIYGLYDPFTNELRYIGKTIQTVELRLRAHLKPSSTVARTHLYNWIRKLLDCGEKPIIRAIDIVSIEEQDNAERYWIAHYRQQGYNLTNYTDGGTGGLTRTGPITAEHAAKLHAGLAKARAEGRIKSRNLTEKERLNLSQKRKGMKFTDEHRSNISRGKQGKSLSEEHRQRIGDANKGRIISEEHRQNISRSKKGKYSPAMQQQIQRLIDARRAKNEISRPNARLVAEQVSEIKALLRQGKSLNTVARQFDVSKRTILFIKQQKTWRDIE